MAAWACENQHTFALLETTITFAFDDIMLEHTQESYGQDNLLSTIPIDSPRGRHHVDQDVSSLQATYCGGPGMTLMDDGRGPGHRHTEFRLLKGFSTHVEVHLDPPVRQITVPRPIFQEWRDGVASPGCCPPENSRSGTGDPSEATRRRHTDDSDFTTSTPTIIILDTSTARPLNIVLETRLSLDFNSISTEIVRL